MKAWPPFAIFSPVSASEIQSLVPRSMPLVFVVPPAAQLASLLLTESERLVVVDDKPVKSQAYRNSVGWCRAECEVAEGEEVIWYEK